MGLLSIVQQAQFLAYQARQAANAQIGGLVRDFVWQSKQLEDSVSRRRELRPRSQAVSNAGDNGRVIDETA